MLRGYNSNNQISTRCAYGAALRNYDRGHTLYSLYNKNNFFDCINNLKARLLKIIHAL